MDSARILSRCRLFARLTPEAREKLTRVAIVRSAPAGEVLFRQGDACPGVFVVGAGLVRVYKLAPTGKEHVLHLAGPGGTFAEAAVMGAFPCPANAEVAEDAEIVMLPADAFRRFLEEDHRACIDLLAGMSAWVHHMVDLLEDVVLRDAAGRVSRHLLAHANEAGHVRLPAERKVLASQLNLTAETLSRTLRKLGEDGLIASERDAILVLDREGLGAVAEGLYPAL